MANQTTNHSTGTVKSEIIVVNNIAMAVERDWWLQFKLQLRAVWMTYWMDEDDNA